MKVIEIVKNNRTGEVAEVSWGDNITSDWSIVSSVGGIMEQARARANGEIKNFPGRFTTLEIRIEL